MIWRRFRELWRARHKREYRSPKYDTYQVMRLIAPPGFISRFMQADACKVHPKMGWHVQVPRIDKEWLKTAGVAFKMDELPTDPRILTDRLEFNKYLTPLGACLVYVVDMETKVMYYWDSEEFESTHTFYSQVAMHNHLRRLLRECIKEH